MSAWVLAASVGHLVEQIGAYAGYASIIGLGIMALLYFTQAREVKRLREWAGREPDRAAELAQRVQADPTRRVVAQPLQPSTAAAQQQATAALYASVGATPPPGVGAPPPGSLARPTPAPTPVPAPGAVVPGAPTGAPAAPAAIPAVGATPAVAAQGAPATTPGTPTPAPAPTPTPVPGVPGTATATATPPAATAASAGAAAASRSPSPAPIYGNGAVNQDTRESAAARPGPLGSFADADDEDDGDGLTTGRIAAFVVGGMVAIAVAAVLVISLTGDDGTPAKPNDFGDTPAASSGAGTGSGAGTSSGTAADSGSASNTLSTAERRATKVAVLNGTTRTGLARTVGDRIEKARFTLGAVTNNVDQQVPATIISYTAGNKPAALAVAKSIGVDAGSVQQADANTTTAAADADVVVTVGSDQIE